MTDPAPEPSALHLILTPERAALARGVPNVLRVLVRVQARDAPDGEAPREPLDLALVIDRSGSMSGVPLAEAKRCAAQIVDHLGAGDRATVVAFDDEVERLVPLSGGAQRDALRAALASIESGGSTDLHGGWRAGAQTLADVLVPDGIRRVILLSDGCANCGETDLETIAGQCRDMAKHGVATSTYGLGRHFNEDLMLAMASAGRGNAYYGETAADLAEPFEAEFALLTALCARGLVLRVNAPEGVGVRVRNDYAQVDGDPRAWRLPDVAFASEAWALLELDVPAPLARGTALSPAITVAIEAAGRDSAPLFLMAALPPLAVVDADAHAAIAPDGLVARRILELDAADTLRAVRACVAAHDWAGAQRLLLDATARFGAHDWAAAVLATMTKLVARRDEAIARKEAAFAQMTMSTRLARRDEASFDASEAGVPAFLRRKSEQGKGRPRS